MRAQVPPPQSKIGPPSCLLLLLLASCGENGTPPPQAGSESVLPLVSVLFTGDPSLQAGCSTRDVCFVGRSLFTLSSCVQRWDPAGGIELRSDEVELQDLRCNGDEALHGTASLGLLGMSDGGRFYAWSEEDRGGALASEPAFAVTTGGYRHMSYVAGLDRFAVYTKERIDFVDRATSTEATEQTLEQGIERVLGASHSYATALSDNRIVLWPCDDSVKGMVLQGHGAPVIEMAYHPDESQLASVDRDGQLILWNLTDGTEIRRWTLEVSRAVPAAELAFVPGRDVLVTNGSDDALSFWSTRSGELIHSQVVPGGGIISLAISDGGELLAAGLAFSGRFDQNALEEIQESYGDPRILESGPAMVLDLSDLPREEAR